jgi:hypothetical protein
MNFQFSFCAAMCEILGFQTLTKFMKINDYNSSVVAFYALRQGACLLLGFESWKDFQIDQKPWVSEVPACVLLLGKVRALQLDKKQRRAARAAFGSVLSESFRGIRIHKYIEYKDAKDGHGGYDPPLPSHSDPEWDHWWDNAAQTFFSRRRKFPVSESLQKLAKAEILADQFNQMGFID